MEEALGKANSRSYVRERRAFAAPQPPLLVFLDGLAIVWLSAAPLLGVILFGAVRMWSIAPLLLLSLLGIAVAALRRFLYPNSAALYVPMAGWVFGIWLVYAAILAWRSVVPYESRVEWLKIAGYAGAYWAWTDLAMRRGRWRVLLGVLIFWVTLISWYALIQHAHGSRMVLGIERPDVYGMRASGTFICPNHFAALLEIVLALSLALMLCNEAGAPLRLLGGYSLIVCLPVMFLTMSRSGWLGTLVGLGVVLSSLAWRRGGRALVVTMISGMALVAVIALVGWKLSPDIRERIRGASLDHPDPAVAARFGMWRDTWSMIKTRPWLGYGPGSFVWVYPQFKSMDTHMLFNYAHNEYLHAAAEYGIPGLMLLGSGFLWIALRLLYRLRKLQHAKDAALVSALLGIMASQAVHALFDFNLHIFSIWQVLALVGGVVMGRLYVSGELTPRRMPLRVGRYVFAGSICLALVLAAFLAQAYAGYAFHRLGEKAWERLQLDRAERMFRRSTWVDPRYWRAHQGLGHVFRIRAIWNWDENEKRNLAQKAFQAYARAWELNPLDVETRYAMATVHNLLGEKEAALDLMREVTRLHPTHLFYLNRLGLQLRQMGRYQEAQEVFRDVQRRWGTTMAGLNIRYIEEALKESPSEMPSP